MNDPSRAVPVSELLAESGWVRDLARRLVRDPQAADDLVQDTWVAALQRPPSAGRPVRRWLAAVLRNVARQEHRLGERRSAREADVARRERLPSTSELVERAALQRSVADAVLRLDEPYRTTVLLRFFEELPPREIARRQGVPVETVHTRLGRATSKLRAMLDGEHGGRSAWALAVLPAIDRGGPLALPPLGALAMKVPLQVLAVSVAALGAVGVWYALGREPAAPDVSAPVLASAPAEVPAPEGLELGPAPTTARESVAPPEPSRAGPAATPEPEPPDAPSAALFGRVLDANSGAPLAGVALALHGHRVGGATSLSDASGSYRFDDPPRHATVESASPTLVTVFAGIHAPDRPGPTVVVAPRVSLEGVVVDAGGLPVDAARVAVALPESIAARLETALDHSARQQWATSTDAGGRFALLDAPGVEGALVRVIADGHQPLAVALPLRSTSDWRLVLPAASVDGERVAGRVVDAGGAPVEGASVSYGIDGRTTGPDGRFAFPLHDPDSFGARVGIEPVDVVAAHAGYLPVRFEPPRGPDGEARWPEEVVLRLELETFSLAGTLVDANGEPFPGGRVWLADAEMFAAVDRRPALLESLLGGRPDSSWPWTETDERGRWSLDGLRDRDYLVRAMDPESLSIVEVGPVARGRTDVELAFPAGALYPRVAGRVVDRHGDGVAGVSVAPMCDAFQARFRGRIVSTQHQRRPGVATRDDGSFEIADVPRDLVYLRVDGETILPVEYGRYVEGDRRFADLDTRGLPAESIEDLEIVVSRRCHLQVHLADPADADELRVLDRDGRALELSVFEGNQRREGRSQPIQDGRTPVMSAPDAGVELVLLRAGEEVLRTALDLRFGEVVRVDL